MCSSTYQVAGRLSEVDRLKPQSQWRVWTRFEISPLAELVWILRAVYIFRRTR